MAGGLGDDVRRLALPLRVGVGERRALDALRRLVQRLGSPARVGRLVTGQCVQERVGGVDGVGDLGGGAPAGGGPLLEQSQGVTVAVVQVLQGGFLHGGGDRDDRRADAHVQPQRLLGDQLGVGGAGGGDGQRGLAAGQGCGQQPLGGGEGAAAGVPGCCFGDGVPVVQREHRLLLMAAGRRRMPHSRRRMPRSRGRVARSRMPRSRRRVARRALSPRARRMRVAGGMALANGDAGGHRGLCVLGPGRRAGGASRAAGRCDRKRAAGDSDYYHRCCRRLGAGGQRTGQPGDVRPQRGRRRGAQGRGECRGHGGQDGQDDRSGGLGGGCAQHGAPCE